jgi:hypothetical protein
MSRFNYCDSVRRLLIATALPLALTAATTISAHAGVVTVRGANGANGVPRFPPPPTPNLRTDVAVRVILLRCDSVGEGIFHLRGRNLA